MRAHDLITDKCNDKYLRLRRHVADHCTNDPLDMAKNSNFDVTFPHATKSHSLAILTSTQFPRTRLTNCDPIPSIGWLRIYSHSHSFRVPKLTEQKIVRLSPIDAKIMRNC